MRLILVRHAHTKAHGNNKTIGHSDSPLSDQGISQCRQIAMFLKNQQIDVCICSDLNRAYKTARNALRYHKTVPIQKDERLRERDLGSLDGIDKDEFQKVFSKSSKSWLSFSPPKGESLSSVSKRVKSWYNDLVKQNVGKTILVVTHSCPITILHMHLLKMSENDWDKLLPKACAVSIYEINGGKHKPVMINSIKHMIN